MKQYFDIPISKNDLLTDPIAQFKIWYEQAISKGEIEPSAMTLATVNKDYDVTARMVLLKSFDETGFGFFTNYNSPKAQYLKEISKAAMVFWWPLCQRQIRITGTTILLNDKQSDLYFAQRSKESRIAAIISNQSEEIPNREYLTSRYEELLKKYENQENVERPTYWGGFLLQPVKIEFWQGRTHRLHDRFEYHKLGNFWEIVQLSP